MWKILQGDWVEQLRTLEHESVNCCVTSPPYWGLRDYGIEGQLGLERTPDEYVAKMVEGFREVRRVLRRDATLWLNLGDCYATKPFYDGDTIDPKWKQARNRGRNNGPNRQPIDGLKHKDVVGVPWILALALRADGWWLRQAMPWIKRNAMPESADDRPTTQCEYIFLLAKSARYFYNADAVMMPTSGTAHARGSGVNPKAKIPGPNSRIYQDRDTSHPPARKNRQNESFSAAVKSLVDERQRRSYDWFVDSWEGMLTDELGYPLAMVVNSAPYPGAHFATFPPKLVEPCILAECPEGGTVLDPFSGAGTTGLVATRLQRNFVGVELNPEYVKMATRRIEQDQPLFNKQEQ